MRTVNSLLASALFFFSLGAFATQELNDTHLYYTIGGGAPISGSANQETVIDILEASVDWNVDMSCGAAFDPKVSISNQLNGVTEGFKDMMGDMLKNATGAVNGANLRDHF